MAIEACPLYLLSPAYDTPEVGNAIQGFHREWLRLHEADEGLCLHHYTDLKGLEGILRSRSLWFGHASAFNDPLEIQYGKKVVADAVKSAMEAEDRSDVRDFHNHLLIHVEAFAEVLFHVYLASFCESDNLLSQWRGYADRGGGYCLSFEFTPNTRMSDIAEMTIDKPLFLRKVIYEQEKQQ